MSPTERFAMASRAILADLERARRANVRAVPPPPESGMRMRSSAGPKRKQTAGSRYRDARRFYHHKVEGHWCMIPCGPGSTRRRKVWRNTYWRGDQGLSPSRSTLARHGSRLEARNRAA